MISLFFNCAKVWTHLVKWLCRITGRPHVTLSREPIPVRTSAKEPA